MAQIRGNLDTVKASLDGRESEVGDQTLRNPGLDQSRERRIFWLHFVAIEVLESANLQTGAEVFEVYVALLQKPADVVVGAGVL